MLGTVFRNIICRYMSLYMIDGDKRFFVCIGKSLCEIYADKQRPISPGYAVTAIASSSFTDSPASLSASDVILDIISQCALLAISGTTPP